MKTTDEFTILCERCGYVVEGLGAQTGCPECGRAVAESFPGVRPGSPAQRDRGIRARVSTWVLFLRSPVRSFQTLRTDPVAARWYAAANLVLAGALFGGTNSLLRLAANLLEGGLAGGDDSTGFGWLYRTAELSLRFVAWSVAAFAVLVALTFVEGYGMTLASRLRGWRSSRAIAEVVLQHATVGWVIGGFLTYAGAAIACVWIGLARDHAWARWELTYHAHYLLPIAGSLFGLLVFEGLAFFGMRALRYANRAKPAGV